MNQKVEEAFDDCQQSFFQRLNYKSEYKVKIVKDGDLVDFTIINSFKNHYQDILEENETDSRIKEYEQQESGYYKSNLTR